MENGKIITNKYPLIHFTYNTLEQYLEKQNFYSSIAAREKYVPGKYYIFLPATIILKTVWKFIEVYIFKLGMFDGFHGFIAAIETSNSTFLKYLKVWELSHLNKKNISR